MEKQSQDALSRNPSMGLLPNPLPVQGRSSTMGKGKGNGVRRFAVQTVILSLCLGVLRQVIPSVLCQARKQALGSSDLKGN